MRASKSTASVFCIERRLMGVIAKLECDCGYQRRLFLGSGMKPPEPELVARVFPGEDESLFAAAWRDGTLQSCEMENQIAYCPACKDYEASPVLRFRVGDEEFDRRANCSSCAGPLQYMQPSEYCVCPQCGKKIKLNENGGFWD